MGDVGDQLKRALRSARIRLPEPWSLLLGRAAYLPALVRSPDTRRHFREEAAIAAILESGGRLEHGGRGFSERVIEIPWVAGRIPTGARRVLDTGTAYAPLVHHRLLHRLNAEVVGADLTPFELPGVRCEVADLRSLPFADGSFDATLCISTLEHIGMDNRVYHEAVRDPMQAEGDLIALRELGRVTRPGGRVLVTVPGGRDESFGWHRQYSPAAFGTLVEAAGLEPVEIDCFVYEDGWRAATPDELATRTYAQGAVAAAALICASLTR